MAYIDIFFDEKPTEKLDSAKLDCLYAVQFVKNSKGEYWHALVTEEQYNWRIANGKSAFVWQDWCESKPKCFKKIKDDKGQDKNCPMHVFGATVNCPKSKKLIVPDAKQDIDLTAKPVFP